MSDDEATANDPEQEQATSRARALAGVWSDLDWENVVDALDRIRHESVPTPPIDDL